MKPGLTYCNPLPLPSYQQGRLFRSNPGYKGPSFREMADPTVIRWQGKWYLFPSAGLLWSSDDMMHWEFHPIEPFDPGYAPTVVQHGEDLYLSASWDESSIWRAKHPLGPWERLGTPGRDADNNPTWLKDERGNPVRWGDPCLFVDDDGAMYCYCNQARPAPPGARWKLEPCDGEIFGVRLRDDDPSRFAHAPVRLFAFDPAHRWECMGEFNQNRHTRILEGPWMNKVNGRYYLQYSANGTEFTNYAVGCYIGGKPLGPFTYQSRNPILIAPRGSLVNGCAHHSVVEGPGGRLWCFYTTLVGIDYRYERRIGMDPVGFDEKGEMFVAGPTETPQFAPGLVADPARGNSPGWIPLSVHARATASSSAPGRDPSYAVDQYIRTWWEAADSVTPQWLEIDLDHPYEVHAARILFADRGLDYAAGVRPGPYRYVIEGSVDGRDWRTLLDFGKNEEDRHIAYHTFSPQKARQVRLTVLSAPPGMRLGIWEFTVFGNPS